jgi:DNA-binding transcriptional LysR family regulator
MSNTEPGHSGLLDVELLRTFTAVVDHGSFNRASRAVFRTPSAVSMQMKRLEEGLERCLFDRDRRGVALTADGEALLGCARRMLKLNEEAVSYFRAPPLEGFAQTI